MDRETLNTDSPVLERNGISFHFHEAALRLKEIVTTNSELILRIFRSVLRAGRGILAMEQPVTRWHPRISLWARELIRYN